MKLKNIYKKYCRGGVGFLFFILPFFIQAQSASLNMAIDTMNFRGVSEEDPLLEKRFVEKQAFYSFRPPAGWKPSVIPLGASRNPQLFKYRTRFKSAVHENMLEISFVEGGPKEINKATLSLFRGKFTGTLRQQGDFQLLGSDLFKFDHYYCVQVMARKEKRIFLQILVFDQPGQFLQILYDISQKDYNHLSKTIEASFASLQWPSL